MTTAWVSVQAFNRRPPPDEPRGRQRSHRATRSGGPIRPRSRCAAMSSPSDDDGPCLRRVLGGAFTDTRAGALDSRCRRTLNHSSSNPDPGADDGGGGRRGSRTPASPPPPRTSTQTDTVWEAMRLPGLGHCSITRTREGSHSHSSIMWAFVDGQREAALGADARCDVLWCESMEIRCRRRRRASDGWSTSAEQHPCPRPTAGADLSHVLRRSPRRRPGRPGALPDVASPTARSLAAVSAGRLGQHWGNTRSVSGRRQPSAPHHPSSR
jgi:hypothetical protein